MSQLQFVFAAEGGAGLRRLYVVQRAGISHELLHLLGAEGVDRLKFKIQDFGFVEWLTE
jgi:hypothetical protein